ncbi:hypothetical protein O4215_20635 [Rhodococcus maanshanensis]|uniref:hypothetical protein n=1 Tax=Rhodococcus maanshanensis TaxID=183556 RepID=UPI0022B5AED6|nr:hypothetical protein [Rhodococcus maanshanensis]MCZ4557972.1 hypothetical protein [Rhodococcus maanshanensis]
MHDQPCRLCPPTRSNPVRSGGDACPSCVRKFVEDIRRIPDLMRQLDVTITRTDVVGQRGLGGPSGDDVQPLAFNLRASDSREEVRLVLRRAAAPVPFAPTALPPAVAATAVLRRLPAEMRRPGCAAWIRGITAVLTKAWGSVDQPAAFRFAGRCQGCGATVFAAELQAAVRCRACEAEHDVRQHTAWMREAAEDQWMSAEDMARVLPWFDGAPVKAATIRKWESRGKLEGMSRVGDDGRRQYRVGDILAVHREQRRRLTLSAAA